MATTLETVDRIVITIYFLFVLIVGILVRELMIWLEYMQKSKKEYHASIEYIIIHFHLSSSLH